METLVKQFSTKKLRKLSDEDFMMELQKVLNEPLFQEKDLLDTEIASDLMKEVLEKTTIKIKTISVTKTRKPYERSYRAVVTNPHTKNTFPFTNKTVTLRL